MDPHFKSDFLFFAYMVLNDRDGISTEAYKYLLRLMDTWKIDSLVIRGPGIS